MLGRRLTNVVLAMLAAAAAVAAQAPQLLLDGNPAPGVSSNPTSWGRGPVDGTVNLVFDDGVHGTQLWQSDGTAAGTVRLTNLAGPVIFRFVVTMADLTVFVVERGSAVELWRTDGTPAGTTLLHTSSVTSAFVPPVHPVAHGGVATIVGATSGEWSGAVVLPNLPAAIGLDLGAQALWVDAAQPLGIDAGDATWWSLGF